MSDGEMRAPGVYVRESDGFPNGIVSVPTHVAAFIGYTEKAEYEQRSLMLAPTLIMSLDEFELLFGGSSGDGYGLYEALTCFFDNGGGTACIVSAGPFGRLDKADFSDALTALETVPEPAIVVAPDALRLSEDDYDEVARAIIAHCAGLGSRMAILDLYGGDTAEARTSEGLSAALSRFRAAMASVPQEQRCYAAAYYPWVETEAGTVPPSAALAGLWAMMDGTQGVWNAPANLTVAGATNVAVAIDDSMQQDMNVPLDGLAVNAIRFFGGRGVVVWGARTLDGNSQDFRYIPVQRTRIMIEQSIRCALRAYAFEANDARTWATVSLAISAFLTRSWQQGALAGSRASDAFSVTCGLGSTMTPEDILEGRMNVVVLAALTHPAEFIEFAFSQQMQAA